jgi:hypothetical protein
VPENERIEIETRWSYQKYREEVQKDYERGTAHVLNREIHWHWTSIQDFFIDKLLREEVLKYFDLSNEKQRAVLNITAKKLIAEAEAKLLKK